MSTPMLAADHVSKTYGAGRAAVHAVTDVTLEVAGSEIVLIQGPSGSGKTTLLSMLGGLLRPSSGAVRIGGIDLGRMSEAELARVRALKVGFIFQAFNLLEALTVEENVLFPARLKPPGVGAARHRARELLERLNLTARRNALPRTLSGGEKQRVAIARALINEPCVILADEPTGNLDSHSGQEVMMILHDIAREEGRSVVFVTHDPRVEDVASRILWLEDGSLRDRKVEEHSWTRDPVCGMRIDAELALWFADDDGRRHAFCSQRCKERFQQHPAAFARPV